VRNALFTISAIYGLAILLLSTLVIIGCKRGEPQPEPQQQSELTTEKPSSQSESRLEGNTQAEQAAYKAADAWLALVDAGNYSKSWDQAAEFFRNAVPKQKWQMTSNALRKPLGKMLSRKLKSTRYTTTAPGAPDGEYVIIQYDTSFEHKKSAVETITPMLDKDGTWRVSGYYIK
jgi:hypothetical protein